jgi:hypothetical protein
MRKELKGFEKMFPAEKSFVIFSTEMRLNPFGLPAGLHSVLPPPPKSVCFFLPAPMS